MKENELELLTEFMCKGKAHLDQVAAHLFFFHDKILSSDILPTSVNETRISVILKSDLLEIFLKAYYSH